MERGSLGSTRHDPAQDLGEILAVVEEGGVGGIGLHIHDEVEHVRVEVERLALPPVHLARPALETIPNGRLSDLLRRGNADTRMRQTVSGEEDDRISGKDFSARFVNPKKLATLRQPLLFWEGGVSHGG